MRNKLGLPWKIEVNINKPGLKTVLKLANALDVPIKELFDF